MLRTFACVVVGTAYVANPHARPLPVKDTIVVKAKSERQAIAKAEATFSYTHRDADGIEVARLRRIA